MGSTPTTTDPDGPHIPARRVPGEAVVLREIWRGRIWYARPATVVHDEPNLQMLHVPPRVHCKVPVGTDGASLRLPAQDWTMADSERGATSMLSFAFPDTPYAVILGYDAEGALFEYYINLQTPLERSPVGFDTVEHLLDVTIPADRSTWTWKDEDELAVAVDTGLFTDDDAAWFRHWGERGVEHVLLREPPFDREWGSWRPDPEWEAPELPDAWNLAPV